MEGCNMRELLKERGENMVRYMEDEITSFIQEFEQKELSSEEDVFYFDYIEALQDAVLQIEIHELQ